MKLKLFIVVLYWFTIPAYGALRVNWEHYVHPDCATDIEFCTAGYVVFRAIPPNNFEQISPATELVTDLFFYDEGAVGFRSFWYKAGAIGADGRVLGDTEETCVIHYCHGDANLSGVVDVGDLVLLEQHIQGLIDLCADYQTCRAADANLDGYLDVGDLVTAERFIQDLDAQEAHCVVAMSSNLEWDANTEEDLAGYNIYRSPQSGSSYVKRNTDLVLGTQYEDSILMISTDYYYVATAVNEAGLESDYSNEAARIVSCQ